MNEGKFLLDASKFESTFAVGYDNIGDYVHSITANCQDSSTPGDYSQYFPNQTEHELKAKSRSDLKLLIGASIVAEIRQAVKVQTGYECSAGIAHNKILAKLTAGMNKPNKQTVLPLRSIPQMYATLNLTKVKGLGGKFGTEVCQAFNIKMMGELALIPKEDLIKRFDEKSGNWLFLISKGIDLESVQPRFTNKSIGCCKRFPGGSAITGMSTLLHWLSELATEICERLTQDEAENNRVAKQMTVSYTQTFGPEEITSSRTVSLNHSEADPIANDALDVIRRNTSQFCKPGNPGVLNNSIKYLGISAVKFENKPEIKQNDIQKLFEKQKKTADQAGEQNKTTVEEIMSRKKVSQQDNKSNTLVSMFNKMKEKVPEIINPVPSTSNATSENEEISKASEEIEEDEMLDQKIEAAILEQNNETVYSIENEECNKSLNVSFDEDKLVAQICSADDETSPNPEVPEYEKSYAEFAQINVAPTMITCALCKIRIPEDERQEHADFHIALQLSQQQREEYRKEQKVKIVQKSTPVMAKKAGGTKKHVQTVKHNSLDSFLRKFSTQSSVANVETVKCTECGKDIEVTQLAEHQDYHVARKLQIDMNRNDTSKRKRQSQSPEKEQKQVKAKIISKFFTKK